MEVNVKSQNKHCVRRSPLNKWHIIISQGAFLCLRAERAGAHRIHSHYLCLGPKIYILVSLCVCVLSPERQITSHANTRELFRSFIQVIINISARNPPRTSDSRCLIMNKNAVARFVLSFAAAFMAPLCSQIGCFVSIYEARWASFQSIFQQRDGASGGAGRFDRTRSNALLIHGKRFVPTQQTISAERET